MHLWSGRWAIFAGALAVASMLAGCGNRTASHSPAELQLVNLRTDGRTDPLGIEVAPPHLSWQLQSSARGARQSAYEIRVAENRNDLLAGENLIFSSGKIESDQSVQVAYRGPSLQSRQRYLWQVRVWDAQDRPSPWSAPAAWETGLSAGDWTGDWIDPGLAENPQRPGPAPLLRRTFSVDGEIVSARIYATALGIYELHLNGARVGDELFAPGWTSYDNRLQYQTYDVTNLLKPGANALGAMLGDGWYRGMLGWEVMPQGRHQYGERLALRAQLEVKFADGRTETVATGKQWRAATGPILFSDFYDGERYDARLEREGWSNSDFDDGDWASVRTLEPVKARLISPVAPPVRKIQELSPIRIFKTPAGATVADMGQNMVGWVKLRAAGPAGTTIKLRHAEIMGPDGEIYTENLRSARQHVEYILKGGEEVFEPHFTFQGFRYVEVSGYPGTLAPQSLTGVVIHSDLRQVGRFETSHPLLNQLQQNILWSQKGNFLEVPTDCPQRDERLGWTGDAQLFSATAAFNMDVNGFFTKWLADLAADQTEEGAVPFVVPDVPRLQIRGQRAVGALGWSDAATVVPWNLYLLYGNRAVLANQFDSMAAWVGYQLAESVDHIWDPQVFQPGDWLDYSTTINPQEQGLTATDLLGTAYFARSVDIVRRAAQVLGKAPEAERHAALLADIRSAFVRRFVTDDARVGQGTQTAYVVALEFDLLPENLRARAARHLVEDVRQHGHLTTGLLGTAHLLHVLARFGYLDEAYQLLTREEFPSWLYTVKKEATTIWERWDGIRADGTLQDPKMNSFNHYAFGTVGEFMYRVVAGINPDPAGPGYKRSRIAPRPGGGLTHVEASLDTGYGRLSSAWRLHEGRLELAIEVPANTQSQVRLPRAQLAQVRESGRPLAEAQSVSGALQDAEDVLLDVGSGAYRFAYPWR